MKATFVGGGSIRLLPILRGAMAIPGIFDGGEIFLHDLNVRRAEAMARMLQKTPEFAKIDCRVRWGDSLDEALPGSDAVGVILMAGSLRTFALGRVASYRHGFAQSDNVSQNGAFLGLKGAPILLNIARKMEKHCPQAWLLDFANPIAVHSGMINRHTRIKALGLCQGYNNHSWDLNRILRGKDAFGADIAVEAAGVNHLSFILKGAVGGRDLFRSLDRVAAQPARKLPLQKKWSESMKKNINGSVQGLLKFYRELGVLVFSTEGDGMRHLNYDDALGQALPPAAEITRASALAYVKAKQLGRQKADAVFQDALNRDLPAAFWKQEGPFERNDEDIFVRTLKGIAGVEKTRVVTSRLNKGAIEGIADDVVVEYSQDLYKGGIKPAGRYRIPGVVQGLINSLAVHQTLLGDAAATEDPRLLAQALLAYPVSLYSKRSKALYRDLLKINRDEIARPFHETASYLN